MKVRLIVEKDNAVLFEQDCDISDAESFGKACSYAWVRLRESRLARATSIGALYEELDDQILEDLCAAKWSLARN